MSGGAYYTAKKSIGHIETDPLRNFRFIAKIHHPRLHNQFAEMGFMSISGLSITTEVIPYRQGGHNTTTQKMPGQSDFAPLTLSKGLAVGKDEASYKWMKQLFSVIQGDGTPRGNHEDFRANITIKVLDHPVTDTRKIPVKAAFKVYNAWPQSIAFSDLDAGANAIVVQQMTLAHEGWNFKLANNIGQNSTVSF